MQINEEIKKGRELDSPSSWVLTAHAPGAEPLLARRRLTPRSCTIQARALCPGRNARNNYCRQQTQHLFSLPSPFPPSAVGLWNPSGQPCAPRRPALTWCLNAGPLCAGTARWERARLQAGTGTPAAGKGALSPRGF